MKKILILIPIVLFVFKANCQTNPITTAAAHLSVAPDPKSTAMGDIGVASTPDESSAYFNPAKLAMIENNYGFSINYTPWLSKIVKGVSLGYLTAYKKMDDSKTIGLAINYFNFGEMKYKDEVGTEIGSYNPNELSIEGSFAMKLGENDGLGFTAKYIRSEIANGIEYSGEAIKAGNSFAVDFGYYGQKEVGFSKNMITYGASVTNVGTKMGYGSSKKTFLPMTLRLGSGYKTEFSNNYNSLFVGIEFSKLLVPTPPIYNADGDIEIGQDPNRSVASALFTSFGDAPGGFKEELKEVAFGLGVEYTFNSSFSIRGGYHYESPYKSTRQYITTGIGYNSGIINVNMSYLITIQNPNPLSQTFRIGLGLNFE